MPAGRPTSYKSEYAELGYKLALLGADDKQMADVFGVTEQTVNNWKKSQPGFFESITRGKDIADAEIAEALYNRAKGYEWVDEQAVKRDGEYVTLEIHRRVPPDTQAASLWLRNRQGARWRDKTEVEVDDKRKPARAQTLDEIDGRLAELQHKQAANG